MLQEVVDHLLALPHVIRVEERWEQAHLVIAIELAPGASVPATEARAGAMIAEALPNLPVTVVVFESSPPRYVASDPAFNGKPVLALGSGDFIRLSRSM